MDIHLVTTLVTKDFTFPQHFIVSSLYRGSHVLMILLNNLTIFLAFVINGALFDLVIRYPRSHGKLSEDSSRPLSNFYKDLSLFYDLNEDL